MENRVYGLQSTVYSLQSTVYSLQSTVYSFLSSVICVFLFSCTESKYADFEKSPTGLLYKFHSRGEDTVHPQFGQVVRLKMITHLGDSVLENTDLIYPDGARKNLQQPIFKGAIEEGLIMMTIGDSATFLVSTDSINKYYPAPDSARNFKPNEYLTFDVKLMNIQTREEVMWEEEQKHKLMVQDRKEKEPQEISQYIQDNHLEVKPTPSGLYFMETTKGKGASPRDGDSVVVHYTGSFLDGTVFDSSVKRDEPLGFTLGNKRGVEGLEQALKMMKKGSMAWVIIPSSLGYDSLGFRDPRTRRYFIQPYTPMKFDLQLLDINPKK